MSGLTQPSTSGNGGTSHISQLPVLIIPWTDDGSDDLDDGLSTTKSQLHSSEPGITSQHSLRAPATGAKRSAQFAGEGEQAPWDRRKDTEHLKK